MWQPGCARAHRHRRTRGEQRRSMPPQAGGISSVRARKVYARKEKGRLRGLYRSSRDCASGDRGGGLGRFLELERDLLVLADVDRDLAAVLQATEEQLVGEGAANRVLDQPRHGTSAH